ncbi:MAG: hypothetical protein AAF865_01450 [Pseudomonadota bacterium]
MTTETSYTGMTRTRLAETYNAMAGTELRADSYSKRTWIEMLESMEAEPETPTTEAADDTTDPATEAADEPAPTVKSVVLELAADATLTNRQLAEMAADRLPGSAPTPKSVASILCLARKAGVDVPQRQRPARPRAGDYHPLAAETLLAAETAPELP